MENNVNNFGLFALFFLFWSALAMFVGYALGLTSARNSYNEILQDFYDRVRDVPKRVRGVSIRQAIDSIFYAHTLDLTLITTPPPYEAPKDDELAEEKYI